MPKIYRQVQESILNFRLFLKINRILFLILFPFVTLVIFNILSINELQFFSINFSNFSSTRLFVLLFNFTLIITILLISLPKIPLTPDHLALYSKKIYEDLHSQKESNVIDVKDAEHLLIRAFYALNQFRTSLIVTFTAWGSYYFFSILAYFLTININFENFAIEYPIHSISVYILNIMFILMDTSYFLGAISIIFSIFILAFPTVKMKTSGENVNSFINLFRNFNSRLPYKLYLSIFLLFLLAEISNVFFHITFFYNLIFPSLLGLFAGVSFCFFVGRLDSRFIQAPRLIIFIMYLAAFIIALLPLVQINRLGIVSSFIVNYPLENDSFKDVSLFMDILNQLFRSFAKTILLLDFILKTVLFIFLFWLLKTPRMLLYFVRINVYTRYFKYLNDSIFIKYP